MDIKQAQRIGLSKAQFSLRKDDIISEAKGNEKLSPAVLVALLDRKIHCISIIAWIDKDKLKCLYQPEAKICFHSYLVDKPYGDKFAFSLYIKDNFQNKPQFLLHHEFDGLFSSNNPKNILAQLLPHISQMIGYPVRYDGVYKD